MFPKVSDCKQIHFPKHSFPEQGLVSIEYCISLPFIPKRIYYLYNIDPTSRRGQHAHKSLTQCLIPLNGIVEVHLTDESSKMNFVLSDPTVGLLVQPLIWKELYFSSKETICLIIASNFYSENDYVRNFEDFLHLRKITNEFQTLPHNPNI